MSYSFTEKKRIRKSFAKRANVLDVPFLLATQINSYAEFLQLGVPQETRQNVGLEAAFRSIFPIESHNGSARLLYDGYILGDPPFDVQECQLRGITYAAPLRARIKLALRDRESGQWYAKEGPKDVYMGEIPLMTNNGSFYYQWH